VSAILVEPSITEEERRRAIYAGNTVTYASRKSARALCDLAWELISDAFAPRDPAQAQFELPVERFVEIIAPLKTRFTHHPRAKELLRATLEELGCDPALTYFDVPKLRIVTAGGYLTSGVGYAYKPHRDTWYACPPSQINWWVPISEINERCAFVIHPRYFARAVKNNSNEFDAYRWNAEGRKSAAQYITDDPRPHPHLKEDVQLDWQVLVGRPGSLILFSAQHLHATVPNDAGRTRFSIDFRTVHRGDVEQHAGAALIDSSATGTTLRDFLRATDYERLPEPVVEGYETGEKHGGVLVFDPAALAP
jgi:hypothetical protein